MTLTPTWKGIDSAFGEFMVGVFRQLVVFSAWLQRIKVHIAGVHYLRDGIAEQAGVQLSVLDSSSGGCDDGFLTKTHDTW